MTTDDDVRRTSRRLRDLVEPLAANVYFAPEAHQAYADLGLSYLPGYFCSRGACLGQAPGHVIAAAFAVFKPSLVVGAVDEGWSKTDAASMLDARRHGAVEALRRILGDEPSGVSRATALLRRAGDAATLEGHPLAAGLVSLGFPGDPLADLWRAADIVREHRGDSHTCAWLAAGIGAVEITLLTERWWRLPLRSYAPTRGWSTEEIEAGVEQLRARGWFDGDDFTAAGESVRGEVEAATDRQERSVVEALGDDAEELFAILDPWATAVVEAGGYPADPRSLTRP